MSLFNIKKINFIKVQSDFYKCARKIFIPTPQKFKEIFYIIPHID